MSCAEHTPRRGAPSGSCAAVALFLAAAVALAAGCARPVDLVSADGRPSMAQAMEEAQVTASIRGGDFLDEYKISTGDLINVEVVGMKEFSTEARISPRGEFQLPLYGAIRVLDLTARQAAAHIENLLREGFVKNPRVNVFIVEFTEYQVMVYGAVNTPGPVKLSGPRRLLDVLMMAGGLKETAGTAVMIYRSNPSKELIAEQRARLRVLGTVAEGHDVKTPGTEVVDLNKLVYEGNYLLNVPIYPQDRINVPHAGRVYVRGVVEKPGEYALRGSQTTLTQIIAQAGGYLPFKAASEITIKRRSRISGEIDRISIDIRDILEDRSPDIALVDGDDIYFPTTWWRASISNTLTFLDRLLFGFGPGMVR